jgi:Asp-tRNA(Asn)/Glu-tRNA(Gln) amidotransferase C subunit
MQLFAIELDNGMDYEDFRYVVVMVIAHDHAQALALAKAHKDIAGHYDVCKNIDPENVMDYITIMPFVEVVRIDTPRVIKIFRS